MSRRKVSKVARTVLIGALGLTTATCAPMRTMSTAFPLPSIIVGAEHAACTPKPAAEPSLKVVRARVDLRRRLRPVDGGTTPLDPRIGILARELRRPARLEPGMIVEVVYREFDSPPVTCGVSTSGAAAKSEVAPERELVAVRVGTGRTALTAFHAKADGDAAGGFYTRDGKPLERAFLRYPVEFMLVTSGFSYGRPHPILKKRKPHLGVDFAAPRGTPVVAVADGEVTQAKWVAYHGRHVVIRHADGSTSGYSHLERIATGLVVGSRVSKGEVIGTVGTSGLSTGPHLHFALTRRGKIVNPLGSDAPVLPRLSGTALARLKTSASEADSALIAAAPAPVKPIQIARSTTGTAKTKVSSRSPR